MKSGPRPGHHAIQTGLLGWFGLASMAQGYRQALSAECLSQCCSALCGSFSLSPIGEVFRARLRQFPSLVNCCTIDWFNEWPAEALQSVATMFLNEIPELECSNEVIQGLVGILLRSSLLGRNVSLNRGSGSLKPTTISKGLERWH